MTFVLWYLTIGLAFRLLDSLAIPFIMGKAREPYKPAHVVICWVFAICQGICVYILWTIS